MLGEFIAHIAGNIIQEFCRGFIELGWSKDTFKRKLYWTSFIILNIVMFAFLLTFNKGPITTITDGLILFLISFFLSFLIINFCWGIWRFIKEWLKVSSR